MRKAFISLSLIGICIVIFITIWKVNLDNASISLSSDYNTIVNKTIPGEEELWYSGTLGAYSIMESIVLDRIHGVALSENGTGLIVVGSIGTSNEMIFIQDDQKINGPKDYIENIRYNDDGTISYIFGSIGNQRIIDHGKEITINNKNTFDLVSVISSGHKDKVYYVIRVRDTSNNYGSIIYYDGKILYSGGLLNWGDIDIKINGSSSTILIRKNKNIYKDGVKLNLPDEINPVGFYYSNNGDDLYIRSESPNGSDNLTKEDGTIIFGGIKFINIDKNTYYTESRFGKFMYFSGTLIKVQNNESVTRILDSITGNGVAYLITDGNEQKFMNMGGIDDKYIYTERPASTQTGGYSYKENLMENGRVLFECYTTIGEISFVNQVPLFVCGKNLVYGTKTLLTNENSTFTQGIEYAISSKGDIAYIDNAKLRINGLPVDDSKEYQPPIKFSKDGNSFVVVIKSDKISSFGPMKKVVYLKMR